MNNLAVVVGRECAPHVIIVGNSFKMVSTALMLRVALGRHISASRWVAIALITGGVILAQLPEDLADQQQVVPECEGCLSSVVMLCRANSEGSQGSLRFVY